MASKLPFLHVNGSPSPSTEFQRLRLLPSRQNLPSFPTANNSVHHHLSSYSSSLYPTSPSPDRIPNFLSPQLFPQGANPIGSLTVRSRLNIPLISPDDEWGTWTALFSIGAFGIWSEKTKIGSALSGALVSTLVGLAASNVGIIACDAKAFKVVLDFLLPLAVPLLLFRADLRRVIQSTGKLLLAFLLGSVATTVGTALAYLMVPMRSLGQDSWKIAAALMGRHIGGAVNYVAIANALEVSPSVLAAGLAADNVICAVYFTTLFVLASNIPPEASSSTAGFFRRDPFWSHGPVTFGCVQLWSCHSPKNRNVSFIPGYTTDVDATENTMTKIVTERTKTFADVVAEEGSNSCSALLSLHHWLTSFDFIKQQASLRKQIHKSCSKQLDHLSKYHEEHIQSWGGRPLRNLKALNQFPFI